MKAQNVIAFEYKKEDRVYTMLLPHGAPLGEAYEASASFLGEMVRMINENAQKSTPQEPKENDNAKKADSIKVEE